MIDVFHICKISNVSTLKKKIEASICMAMKSLKSAYLNFFPHGTEGEPFSKETFLGCHYITMRFYGCCLMT